MMTGHQAGTGRRADRAGGIEVGQLHSLLGHPVHIRSLKFFLTETGKIPISRIVYHDVYEVGLL